MQGRCAFAGQVWPGCDHPARVELSDAWGPRWLRRARMAHSSFPKKLLCDAPWIRPLAKESINTHINKHKERIRTDTYEIRTDHGYIIYAGMFGFAHVFAQVCVKMHLRLSGVVSTWDYNHYMKTQSGAFAGATSFAGRFQKLIPPRILLRLQVAPSN